MAHAIPARRPRFAETYDPRGRKRPSRAMGDMNVTPFIDVLLVLLIMLIMAVPIKVHETSVDLPTAPQDLPRFEILATNTVSITPQDQLLWNGNPLTRDQLSAQVRAASQMEDEPLLRFEPDANASYNQSARTIVLIKEAGATRFAFVGNHRYASFGQ